MRTVDRIFMYVAEEMNFTAAAERHSVSQQAVSNNIKRLEKELNTKLFYRYPLLELTPAGKQYYEALCRIDRIERSVRESVSDGSEQVCGNISLGISSYRAGMIFPAVFRIYHEIYPNVTFSLSDGHTEDLFEMLKKGKIDLMIGNDVPGQSEFDSITVFQEGICLIASRRFLDQHGISRRPSVESPALNRLPLTHTDASHALTDHIRRFFLQEKIEPNYVCQVSDFFTQLMLSREHLSAFFCPESFLTCQQFIQCMSLSGDDCLEALHINGLKNRLRVEIVSRKKEYEPKYLKEFRKILCDEYRVMFGPDPGLYIYQ